MFLGFRERLRLVVWTALFVVATAAASGRETVKVEPLDVGVAARRVADEILDGRASKQRLPLASDTEHARSIDPVMTRGTAVWIHDALPSPPLTVMSGSVFSYRDLTYDPLDAPVLKGRPTDDDQVIPLLVRVLITPDSEITEGAAVILSFPAPPIFDPRVRHIEGWVGSEATEASIEHSLEDARLDVRVPLTRHQVESAQGLDETISVIVVGELVLGPYRPISPNRLSDLDDLSFEPPLAGLATLEIGRDIENSSQGERLRRIADTLASKSPSAYDRVVAANSWVSNHLRYQVSPATRSAVEALEDRSGDCDEHATLMLALLRATGIPARRATGLLYNFDTLSAHAWVEVGLPKRDGAVHWFIVDPTLAGTSPAEEEKTTYVQFRNRTLLYPMRPSVSLKGMTGQRTTDILLNWRNQAERPISGPSEAIKFVDLVTSSVDQEISGGAQRLANAGLLLHRESASILGSPYLIVDRPLASESPSAIQLRLENEERLVLDLTAGDGSEIDDEVISRLRATYRDLSSTFFSGRPAYHNLELVYLRDRHSDQLHTVSLRVGRYVVEQNLARILKRLSKGGFLMEEETERISAVAEASGGKNLYLLQELARRLPEVDSR
jgi:transglutaminase-like putative cysteine protease